MHYWRSPCLRTLSKHVSRQRPQQGYARGYGVTRARGSASLAVLLLVFAGCSGDVAPVEDYDDTEVVERLSSLENRVSELEEEAEQSQPQPATPAPEDQAAAYLSVGDSERQSYPTMQACQNARASILDQYDQQCRASGAIACSNPRVLCIPS